MPKQEKPISDADQYWYKKGYQAALKDVKVSLEKMQERKAEPEKT